MIPIRQLLNRIRWDAAFAQGAFELGYLDRVEQRVIRVPLRDISLSPETPHMFRILDEEGRAHHVPFHRVREVFRDGERIWHRPHRA